MTRKTTKKSVTRVKKSKHLLLKITAIFVLIATIVGASFLGFRHIKRDAVKIIPNVTTPNVTEFTDENYITITGGAPDVNNARKLTEPRPLIIRYESTNGKYTPAFKMDMSDKEIAQDVEIRPNIRGTWAMRGNTAIAFMPDAPWPADERFVVKISPKLFGPDVRPDTRKISFKTPEIIAHINSFNIYPAMSGSRNVIAVAAVSFNYPVNTQNFSDHVSMTLNGHDIEFSTRFDRFARTVLITSEPCLVTNAPQTVRIKINSVSGAKSNAKTKKITANATIDAADNLFKLSDITTTVVDNDDTAQQLLILDLTGRVSNNTKWNDYIKLYLLPKYRDENAGATHTWRPDEITPDVIAKSKQLKISPTQIESPSGVYQYAFGYDVSDKSDRYIYVELAPGMESTAGFKMANGATRVLRAAYPTPSVKIAGTGALLSLGGERKIGIVARGGVDGAYINLAKVKGDEINHLISQTYSVFAPNIDFKSWSFGTYDMSVVFSRHITFADASMMRTNYASIDLGQYLDKTGSDKTGIFIVQAGANKNAAEYADRRLILLTNLGIIRKINLNNTSTLFISNIDSGTPATDVDVTVLGRNGDAIWSGQTDTGGRVDIPEFEWREYRNQREPVAFVARRGNDVSFIPYDAYGTRVDYSKYNVNGEYEKNTTPMNAFIFSDRGIYRPGETAFIGSIIRTRDFVAPDGIPVRIEIRDARGRVALERTFTPGLDGMTETKYQIPETAPLGEYTITIWTLNAKNNPNDLIGNTTIRVEEFVPDTMKITAQIKNGNDRGWISPDDIHVNASLNNLFGTPVAAGKISGTFVLRPTTFTFEKYSRYVFGTIPGNDVSDVAINKSGTFSTSVENISTDADGNAMLDIKFDNEIPSGTYTLGGTIRGIGPGDGRGVQTAVSARVSTYPFIIGHWANSDLRYIARDSDRQIKFIALDSNGNAYSASGLQMRVLRRENLTSLVKDYNNYYKYQTITRDRIIEQRSFDIPKNGSTLDLDTRNGGTYILQILNNSEQVLDSIEYFIAGDTNATLQTDTNATLEIRLDNDKYAPGDKIAVNITAPYSGTGLITIERDRVYAYKWFNTNKTSSVQYITVPKGFEGTGYINVSFVRDINSRDIFTSPYAYAVAPFTADIARRTIDIKLSAPEQVSGGKLDIKYRTNRDGRIMIFAVDSGILQVARHKMPNPLGYFFQKRALQVDTFQILSLLLPEYKILREFAKTGGGDYGEGGNNEMIFANPFSRKNNSPVAFYSGIINARANKTESVSFTIPEYFNGELKIFAVAAGAATVGAANTETRVAPDAIITMNSPLMVAPADTFDTGIVISNMTDYNAVATTDISTDGDIKIANTDTVTMGINAHADKSITKTIAVGDMPGMAEINTDTTLKHENGDIIATRRATATLSVRPATNFQTKISAGIMDSPTTKIKNLATVNLYPEFATQRIYISAGAFALIQPLARFLYEYEYPCSEQLASRGIAYLIMKPHDTDTKIREIINTLKNRQNDDGSFDLWAGGAMGRDNESNTNSAYVTGYVTQFLIMARDAGFTVPNGLIERGTDFLRTFAAQNITTRPQARAAAFAIYIATRAGYVTTGYIDAFQEYANREMDDWPRTITGAYIATAYKIMHQDAIAEKLISQYKTSPDKKFVFRDTFDNNVANDSIFEYLGATYFGGAATEITPAMTTYINTGNYSSFTSAMIIMALGGNMDAAENMLRNITISGNDGTILNHVIEKSAIVADIPANTDEIKIKCDECNGDKKLNYAIIQSGFPRIARAQSNGLMVTRKYYDSTGNQITRAKIGDEITVRISVRATGDVEYADNIVISDLLPGGFVADSQSVTGDMEYSQTRTDRVLIFTDATRRAATITYTVAPSVAGTFTIPAIYAQSMYNPNVYSTGQSGKFVVTNE